METAESAYSLFIRGTELLESGNPAQAAVLLEKAVALEPDKASIRESLGRAYYNYGEYRLAEVHFKEAVNLHPSDDFAHFCLALCYQRAGRIVTALGHIKLALAMSPDSKNYRSLLSRLESRLALRLRQAGQAGEHRGQADA